ncbi:hypothetical protein M0R19_01800 [Candidatus Pacearchaeota archaeon]|nr:hypothetical protein [Candidatus Pacearchaeota archaeon]
MGHYAAEMPSREEIEKFHEQYRNYQNKRAREISNIIKKNKIKLDDINLGDTLVLYPPLLKKSKHRFADYEDYEPIRKFFDSRVGYYDFSMWTLAWLDEFTVYDKSFTQDNLRNERTDLVRIDKPREWNFFQKWIPIQYFSKK